MYKVKKEKVTLNNLVSNKKLKCTIDFNDSSLYGKNVRFNLVSEVKVKKKSPVNRKKVLFKKNFIINSARESIFVDLSKYKNYSYKGKDININMYVEVIVDDAIFFDTKVTNKIQNEIGIKPKISYYSSRLIINPEDIFKFKENIKVLPFFTKIWLTGLSLFLILLLIYFLLNTSINLIFLKILSPVGMGALIWIIIKSQLQNYMTFFFKKTKFLGDIKKDYRIRDIINGKSRVDLKNVELKIVACNKEEGEHVTGNGKNRSTKSFSIPVGAITLYTEKVDFIPKDTNISEYFKGSFSFERMYKALYPEQMIGYSHGIKVYWEVQLISDTFKDQELVGNSSFLKYKNFL